MASLLVLKGPKPGEKLKLEGTQIVLGRNPDCTIVLPSNAVSRQHARILAEGGRYFIEDLNSRNRTFLNNQEVNGKVALKENDRIKICDFLYTFHQDAPIQAPLPGELRGQTILGPTVEDDEDDGPVGTVEATLNRVPSTQFLETQPNERLRAILEVSTSLGRTIQVDLLLEQVAETLFNLFRQADRCFVILRDDATGALIPKVIRTRRPGTDTTARFSKTIVKKCMETQTSLLSEDASNDNKIGLSQSIAEFRIRSVMCSPLVAQEGRPSLGVIQLDSQDRTKKFTQDDLNLLVGVCNQAAVAIEKAKLTEDMVAREKLQRDLELAATVQRSFLPSRPPQVVGYEFYAKYESALTVGGDYYDFIPLTDGKMAILLGDVAGKGMPAALFMAKLSAEARFSMLTQPDLALAIAQLNDQLMQAGLLDRFVTLAAVVLDPLANTITVVNAGHMSPLIARRATGSIEDAISTRASGLPLGVMEGMPFDAVTVDLQPGDFVTVFTDGVTDALSLQGEAFGMDNVYKALGSDPSFGDVWLTPTQAGERLYQMVKKHAAGRSQNDDIAIVCFGRVDQALSGIMMRGAEQPATRPLEVDLGDDA